MLIIVMTGRFKCTTFAKLGGQLIADFDDKIGKKKGKIPTVAT